MTKALTVLAECVDERSGKRFHRGDVFDPAPGVEQAKRLIRARCLPETALDVAAKAETEAEKAAEKAAKIRAAEEDKIAKAQAEAREKAAKRLADAKAKGLGNLDPAAAQTSQIGDELFDLTDEQLAEVVSTEEVVVDAGADKVAIIAAIRAKRAA